MTLNNRNTKNRGFTIVELLIVIVVIGILAAITIVAYNGVQNRAHTTTAQSAAKEYANKAEVYAADNSGTYPALSVLTGAASSETYALSSGIQTANDNTAPTKTNPVEYTLCPGNDGVIVSYYDFSAGGTSSTTFKQGDASSCTPGV